MQVTQSRPCGDQPLTLSQTSALQRGDVPRGNRYNQVYPYHGKTSKFRRRSAAVHSATGFHNQYPADEWRQWVAAEMRADALVKDDA